MKAKLLGAKNLGRAFSTWTPKAAEMPPDGTMVPRIKGGGGVRALIEPTDDYFQRGDRDVPFRTVDRITGLPVIIRRAACGLGCRCDATVEVDMPAYYEWRRVTLGRWIPRVLGVTDERTIRQIARRAAAHEAAYIDDGRLSGPARDEGTIAGILRLAQNEVLKQIKARS